MANPAFVNPRLTPAQADALAATFRPSWELDEPATSPDATLTDADIARLHANGNANGGPLAAVQNGRHVSEAHLPPPPRQASEPEDSVIIDRSITANELARTAPAAPQPQAPAFPTAAAPQNAQPASGRIAVASPAAGPMPMGATLPLAIAPPQQAYAPHQQAPQQAYAPSPQQAYVPPARAVAMPRAAVDDDFAPPRSKTGLFIGLGAVGLVLIAGIAIVVAKSGDDTPPAPTSTSTAQKAEPAKPNIPPPPALTDTPAAATTTPATATKPDKPDPPAKPDKPQRPVAAQQPAANTDPPPPPKPPPPRPPPQRPTVPVKDVPF